LRQVLASVSDCVWSAEIERHGTGPTATVPVIDKITGRPADFFVGGAKHWWTVVSPEDRGHCERAVATWRLGQSSQKNTASSAPTASPGCATAFWPAPCSAGRTSHGVRRTDPDGHHEGKRAEICSGRP